MQICNYRLYPSAIQSAQINVDGPFAAAYHTSKSILTSAMMGEYVQIEYDRHYDGDIHQIEELATDLVTSVLKGRNGSLSTDIRKSNLVMLISNWAGTDKWGTTRTADDNNSTHFTQSLLDIVNLLYSHALRELAHIGTVTDNGCAALLSLVKLAKLSHGDKDGTPEFPLSIFLRNAANQSFIQTGRWSLFSDGPTDQDERPAEISRAARVPYAMAYKSSHTQQWLHDNITQLQ